MKVVVNGIHQVKSTVLGPLQFSLVVKTQSSITGLQGQMKIQQRSLILISWKDQGIPHLHLHPDILGHYVELYIDKPINIVIILPMYPSSCPNYNDHHNEINILWEIYSSDRRSIDCWKVAISRSCWFGTTECRSAEDTKFCRMVVCSLRLATMSPTMILWASYCKMKSETNLADGIGIPYRLRRQVADASGKPPCVIEISPLDRSFWGLGIKWQGELFEVHGIFGWICVDESRYQLQTWINMNLLVINGCAANDIEGW